MTFVSPGQGSENFLMHIKIFFDFFFTDADDKFLVCILSYYHIK